MSVYRYYYISQDSYIIDPLWLHDYSMCKQDLATTTKNGCKAEMYIMVSCRGEEPLPPRGFLQPSKIKSLQSPTGTNFVACCATRQIAMSSHTQYHYNGSMDIAEKNNLYFGPLLIHGSFDILVSYLLLYMIVGL